MSQVLNRWWCMSSLAATIATLNGTYLITHYYTLPQVSRVQYVIYTKVFLIIIWNISIGIISTFQRNISFTIKHISSLAQPLPSSIYHHWLHHLPSNMYHHWLHPSPSSKYHHWPHPLPSSIFHHWLHPIPSSIYHHWLRPLPSSIYQYIIIGPILYSQAYIIIG